MLAFLAAVLVVAIATATLAYALSFAHLAGPVGRRVAAACCGAPVLDGIVSVFTWVPWLVAYAAVGKKGVVAAVIGEVIGLFVWIFGHEMVNRRAVAGPRIVKVLNRTVGRWQNHAALWVTAVALPVFLMIRLAEVAAYPWLVWLLRFPRYDNAEWVNCSRQKFDGLVGHDLIWCLYCDWMTGVYALGAEMLRNVESFWCPIRYYDGKKCENCKTDFPDVNHGWVAADGTMAQVADTLEAMYDNAGDRAWFGHPVRLTVNGRPTAPRQTTPGLG